MTSLTTLDVGRFPTDCLYGRGENQVDLVAEVLLLTPTIKSLIERGKIHDNATSSFGFAVANSYPRLLVSNWDHPYQLVWFVGGWGPDKDRYIANAVRKMRPAARLGVDTLGLRPDQFEDIVESQESDGSYAWGDYPYGGAAFTRFGGRIFLSSVSGFRPEQDDWISKVVAANAGLSMYGVDYTTAMIGH